MNTINKTILSTFAFLILTMSAGADSIFSALNPGVGNVQITQSGGNDLINYSFTNALSFGSVLLTQGNLSFTTTGLININQIPVSSGTAVLSDNSGDSLTFSVVNGGVVKSGPTTSFHSGLSLLSGTGSYSNYNSGSITLQLGWFNLGETHRFASGGFQGNVEAVPEPAGLAILGLGLAGLLIRKK